MNNTFHIDYIWLLKLQIVMYFHQSELAWLNCRFPFLPARRSGAGCRDVQVSAREEEWVHYSHVQVRNVVFVKYVDGNVLYTEQII